MMRANLVLACLGCGFIGTAQSQESPPEAASATYSPYMSVGSARQYLDALNANPDRLHQAPALDAAMMMLEDLDDTTAYLLTPLAVALAEPMAAELARPIRCTVWADLRCVTGESAVIQKGLAEAARFKQLSLPVLWKLRGEAKAWGDLPGSADRARMHLEQVIHTIVQGTAHRQELASALRQSGEPELAEFINAIPQKPGQPASS